MEKKFIRGTFELEKYVDDLEAFESKRMPALKSILDWADSKQIGLTFGTSEDKTYLCEFVIRAETSQMCRGYLSVLKERLKAISKKPQIIFQASGDILR